MDRFLVQTLINIGFPEKESRILLAAFSLGKASAGEIAKRAELKRAIVYVILENLVKRGYMTCVPTRGIRLYLAIPPDKLLKLREQQVKNFRFMLPLMLSHTTSSLNVEFHDTVEGILCVSHTFGRAKRARYLTNYSEIKRAYGEAVMKKWAASSHDPRQKTRVQQLIVDEPDGRAFAAMIRGSKTWRSRFLPTKAHLIPNIDIVDQTVAVTNFDPLFMIAMHSAAIVDAFGYLFDTLWDHCDGIKQTTKPTRRQG